MDFEKVIAREFSLRSWQVKAVIELLDAGNTIPFIARYRKEAHGSVDDQTLREIAERLSYLRSLDRRREEIAGSLTERGALTEELAEKLKAAATLAELEDLYRPYRPKRRTRAAVAKENISPATCPTPKPPWPGRGISSPSGSPTTRSCERN